MYIPIVYLVATVTKQSSPTSSCGSCEAAWSASDCGWKEEIGNFRFAIQMAFDCAECWPNQLAKCSCTSSQEMSPWLSSSRSQTCKIDQVNIKRGNKSLLKSTELKNTSLSFAKVTRRRKSCHLLRDLGLRTAAASSEVPPSSSLSSFLSSLPPSCSAAL